jgi:YD repeat-containing protein
MERAWRGGEFCLPVVLSRIKKFTYPIFCSVIPNAAGRRTSLTLPNDVLVEYSYDNALRLTEITYKQDGTTLLGNLTYEYDKNGNRVKTGGSFARTGLS